AADGLLCGRVAHQLAGVRIERDLAGAEQQPGGGDGMAVGPDRGRSSHGGDGLAMVRHGYSRYLGPWMRARRLLLPVLSCSALLAPVAAHADSIAYSPCPSRAGFECGTLTVPLDPSGAVPGTVDLAVTRAVAASNPQRRALLT